MGKWVEMREGKSSGSMQQVKVSSLDVILCTWKNCWRVSAGGMM